MCADDVVNKDFDADLNVRKHKIDYDGLRHMFQTALGGQLENIKPLVEECNGTVSGWPLSRGGPVSVTMGNLHLKHVMKILREDRLSRMKIDAVYNALYPSFSIPWMWESNIPRRSLMILCSTIAEVSP